MFNSLLSNPLQRILPTFLLLSTLLNDHVSAKRVIESTSLNPCMKNSMFAATLFNITFSPDDGQLAIKVNGVSGLSGQVTARVQLIAYGYKAMEKDLDPCGMEGFKGMCPMTQGVIVLDSHVKIEPDIASQIPAIAFQVPDLDGIARITVNRSDTNEMVACVEAPLSNGKTVDQHAVGWTTAIIAGLGLLASAVSSGLGHSNTAAHVAANAVSLFSYFQAQTMIAMTAVKLPPIVAAWTQNFDWGMGIIEIDFMQQALHWYIQATGGLPANLRDRLVEVSVQIAKRSIETTSDVVYSMSRAAMYGMAENVFETQSSPHPLVRRTNNDNSPATAQAEVVVVTGIERLAFKAQIEITNFFMTGLCFFILMVILTALCVAAFKGFCESAVKSGWIKGDKFLDFRNGWLIVLKGIMYRLVLIGFPQLVILCLWEITSRDSVGAVVLAVFFFLSVVGILGWASFKVVMIAQRSVSLHKNPAYILYSDPAALNRWGFLYVQFRASHYYFIVPLLAYFLLKAMFIAFGQKSGTLQAFAMVLIEGAFLGAVAYMKPWMDKKTNIFNISIHSINFLNSLFLLVFTGVFKSPEIVAGVMGVIFFVMNAIFALVLLILVLVSSGYALISKNPDVRYQPMRDDRASFIKSSTQMVGSTELDALGATARGDMKRRDLDDDSDSFSGTSTAYGASQVPLPPSTAGSHQPPHSPVDPSVPMFPSSERSTYNQHGLSPGGGSPQRPSSQRSYEYGGGGGGYGQQQQRGQQQMNWQTGVGYER